MPPQATNPNDCGKCTTDDPACTGPSRRSYSVLLLVGLAVPPTLLPPRCALTAPFHPYPCTQPKLGDAGGLLSVALSLGSPPPGVTRHHSSAEPGLSSPSCKAAAIRSSDLLSP
jgi:hypothetical protein